MMYSDKVTLLDGKVIPQLGLGVWKTPPNDAARVVAHAIRTGYRHIDTAAAYENEQGVGQGVRDSGVSRDEVFITTKLWNADQGFDETLRAFDASMKRLKMEWVDLYLIHWPAPQRDRYVDTWRALIRLQQEGRARSIGVSNFEPEHLDRIIADTGVLPVLNQIELHPRFQQRVLQEEHARRGIKTQAWSPLGRGELLDEPLVAKIARQHGRSPAQVMIRWHLQMGNIVIPKSVTPSRILENGSVDNFILAPEEMETIHTLDRRDGRMGPNPLTAQF